MIQIKQENLFKSILDIFTIFELIINQQDWIYYYSFTQLKDEPESVPWAEALSERAELHSETASRAMLGKQLEQCQNRASQLEQESEKWRLETQLLKLRHKKVCL